MLVEDIVRLANQIAHFFAPYPEADAVAGVQDHIEKFWDPGMRRTLNAMSAAEIAVMHPLAQMAAERLRPQPSSGEPA